jgi:Uri superfamily endonuclease
LLLLLGICAQKEKRRRYMKGTYVLIIENNADTKIEIGKIGLIAFRKGFYAYVGSALAGLEQRIGRHLRDVGNNKKLHWHIDYLLANPTVEIKEVICVETGARNECEIAVHINQHLVAIAHFGCTDCSCTSHLFFSTNVAKLKEHVYDSFHSAGAHFRATKINPV